MTVALALFVKNEFQDITAWISWHFAIGVDKIFIYDDWSDDGTFEILIECCKIFNIELNRTKNKEITNFYYRQEYSYKDACKKATEQQFSWIGLLDGDEYVYIEKEDSISIFLDKFEKYNAIALNWKIYGSSNRVIKTKIPTYLAFQEHCDKNLNDCKLVKSFIRPEMYTFEYSDPHKFKMSHEKYADANGNDFEWEGTCKEILWEGAWVNHYICRSMENYIDRIKRRVGSDLKNSSGYWYHFNRNDLTYNIRKDFLIKSEYNMQLIKNKCVSSYVEKISGMKIYSNEYEKEFLYQIQSFHGDFLTINHTEGFLTQSNDFHNENVIFSISYPEYKDFYFLFNIKNKNIQNYIFYINDDERESFSYMFKGEIDNKLISLRSPLTDKYMSCIPQEKNGKIEVNRSHKNDWEKFLFKKTELYLEIKSFPGFINNSFDFIEFLKKNSGLITYNDFIIALGMLNEKEKENIYLNNYGNIIKWL